MLCPIYCARPRWQGKEGFIQPPYFHVGDPVRTIQPVASLPPHSTGKIYHVPRVGDFYGVLFDGEAVIRIMHHGDLEPAVLRERMIGRPDAGARACFKAT